MSEKTEAVEKKSPPPKHPPARQGSSNSGAFLALVIALCAAAASYYIWQQYRVAEQDRRVLEQSIDTLLRVVQEKAQAQQARIEQLQQHRHSEVEQRIASLEQSMPDLHQQLTIQQRQWTLAEVDYLLRTAEHRLQLNRDIPTAITALEQAREQLLKRSNGDYGEVVNAIGEQITALEQLHQESPLQISNQLAALIAAMETLPVQPEAVGEELRTEPPLPPASDAPFSEKAKHWGRMVWHDIKSLVTISHSEDMQVPLLDPQQRQLLQMQLRVSLETARLAAMDHNQPLYRTTLGEADELLQRYFDHRDQGVSGARASLQQLLTLNVDTPLPSLAALRQQLHSVAPQPPHPPEPSAAQPEPATVPPPAAPLPPPSGPAGPQGLDEMPPLPMWGREP